VLTGSLIGAGMESKYHFFEKLTMHAKLGEKKFAEIPVEKNSQAENELPQKVADATALPPLPFLSDKVFETTDDMLVFMFPSEEKFLSQSARVKSIIAQVQNRQADSTCSSDFKKVKMFFTIVPPSDKNAPIGDNVEIMCYKGQRKQRFSLPITEVPLPEFESFFRFHSTPVDSELNSGPIQHVSGIEFEEQVTRMASPEHPILVQMYEKSCFLCFLMRPFLNSLAELLRDKVPFTVKRLDIEENDFPQGVPVVRGTPTFVMFFGEGRDPVRFEEFKPRDLVKRIAGDYRLGKDVESKLYDLVDRVALRFQAFSGIVMWGTESEKILDLLSGDSNHHATIPFDLKSAEDKDKELFNKYVSESMTEDMEKTDGLEENIRNLMRELTAMEKHAIMMGQVIGEKVLEKENSVV
jgi:thiol-disulfide isomerase/thioredoxin